MLLYSCCKNSGKITIIAFLIFLQINFTLSQFPSLDYVSCGIDPVASVQIDNCEKSPCLLHINTQYHVTVQPEYLNPQVDNTEISIGIYQYGARFQQDVNLTNPCILNCPLTTRLVNPVFDIYFNVSHRMIQLPGELQIDSTYHNGDKQIPGFCIKLNVILRNQ